MKNTTLARTGFAAMLVLSVAACGGSSADSRAAANPAYFSSKIADGTMIGTFNSAGYSASEVRKLIAPSCGGKLTGFTTQAKEDGLVAFAATCGSWEQGSQFMEYQRRGQSTVTVEATGSDGRGNLVYDQQETQL